MPVRKPTLISVDQAAALLGVHPRTIRRRILDGTQAASRVGPRLIRVTEADVRKLIRPVPAARP